MEDVAWNRAAHLSYLPAIRTIIFFVFRCGYDFRCLSPYLMIDTNLKKVLGLRNIKVESKVIFIKMGEKLGGCWDAKGVLKQYFKNLLLQVPQKTRCYKVIV